MGKTNNKTTKRESKTAKKSAKSKSAGLSDVLKKQIAFGKKCYEMTNEFLLQPAPGQPDKCIYEVLSQRQVKAVCASRESRLAVTPRNVPNCTGGATAKMLANLGNYLRGIDGMFYPCLSLYS